MFLFIIIPHYSGSRSWWCRTTDRSDHQTSGTHYLSLDLILTSTTKAKHMLSVINSSFLYYDHAPCFQSHITLVLVCRRRAAAMALLVASGEVERNGGSVEVRGWWRIDESVHRRKRKCLVCPSMKTHVYRLSVDVSIDRGISIVSTR